MKQSRVIKKLFLSTTLLGAMIIVPHATMQSDLNENAVDMLQLAEGVQLKSIRKEASSDIQMSETYVQSAVVEGANYLRFVTAVKLTDTMESIVYHRSIAGMNDATKNVEVFYKSINAGESTYYYDGTNLVTEKQDNGFYFACYTIKIESEEHLNSNISCYLTINETESSTKVTSSFVADQSEGKCVSKDTDGNKIIRAEHQYGEHVEETYFKAPATCEHPAEYYKSCDFCGEKSSETFISGEKLAHETSKLVSLNAEGKFVSQDHCSLCDKDVGEGTTADTLVNATGVRIQPITLASADQGLSISYHFAGSTNDWNSVLFTLSEENAFKRNAWWISAGCIGHEIEGGREQLCDGADGQGQDGEFTLNTGWKAILAEGDYTLSLNVDGSIVWYKDNEIKLYFAPNKISHYFKDGEINTASKFVPALINQIKTYGIRVGTGVSNLKISYGDTKWGFATVDFVKEGTTEKIADSVVVGPLREGADVNINYPQVTGYELKNTSETAYTGKMTAGKNVVKTIEYVKTAIIATINCYTGTKDNPGILIHSENKPVTGETYEFDAPSTQMYETKGGKLSGKAEVNDFEINVYGYDLKEGVVDVDMDKGEQYPALPTVNENTGVFISFDYYGPNRNTGNKDYGDWRKLFESEHFVGFSGCVRYVKNRNPWSQTDFYDGAHGTKNKYFNKDVATVIASEQSNVRITFEFAETGDLVLYRNGAEVLKFEANKENNDKVKVSDMVKAFIDDVRTTGFKVCDLDESDNFENNTEVKLNNLQVGYATDLHHDIEYKVMVDGKQVTSYRGTYLTYNPSVPYGYKLISHDFSNGVVTLNCEKTITLSDNLITEPKTIDKYNSSEWGKGRYPIASNIKGDYYYEVEIKDIETNNHSKYAWRGLLLDTLGKSGNRNSDKYICLGNNNYWSTTPPQLVLTSFNNDGSVFDHKFDMKLIMTRRGRFYYVEMICTYDDTTVVNSFAGYGYDATILYLYICSDNVRFTVSSIKSGKQA